LEIVTVLTDRARNVTFYSGEPKELAATRTIILSCGIGLAALIAPITDDLELSMQIVFLPQSLSELFEEARTAASFGASAAFSTLIISKLLNTCQFFPDFLALRMLADYRLIQNELTDTNG
jgi:hypothetical protein